MNRVIGHVHIAQAPQIEQRVALRLLLPDDFPQEQVIRLIGAQFGIGRLINVVDVALVFPDKRERRRPLTDERRP